MVKRNHYIQRKVVELSNTVKRASLVLVPNLCSFTTVPWEFHGIRMHGVPRMPNAHREKSMKLTK